MEEIAFNDWPGQPVDLSGSNPWLPAYGFQPPHTLLDKDDFIGNPDADLFLQGTAGQHYMYLETIQEETSDDLQSESDRSESRASPVGWLATDSESGSVIRIDTLVLDEIDSESEREIACPAKRRRQDPNLLGFSDDESNHSLSRSSSLLQFETLERQCQDISISSPSILSNFSFDSLESQRKTDLSPDSLERDDGEPESDYYKTLKVDLVRPKRSRDSLLYNNVRLSDSESSESTDSERTLEASCKSIGSLKISRSFDNLYHSFQKSKDKMSSENLSEDSGYSDHFCNFVKNKSSSIPNLQTHCEKKASESEFLFATDEFTNSYTAFDACDLDCTFQNFPSTFGSSYQDLSVLDKYEVSAEARNPLIERFVRNGSTKWRPAICDFGVFQRAEAVVNIEKMLECAKYNTASASEPNLIQSLSSTVRSSTEALTLLHLDDQFQQTYGKQQNYLENNICVSSVPKDLNLAGDIKVYNKDNWNLDYFTNSSSIAAKNWDIADLAKTEVEDFDLNANNNLEMREMNENSGVVNKSFVNFSKRESCSVSSGSDIDAASFKREGSYFEAMSNRVDLSDDEYNPCYLENIRKSTIVEFDKNILKTISETSIPSFKGSKEKLNMLFTSTPIATQTRNVVSTPNLATFKSENEIFVDISNSSRNLPRKSSLVQPSSSTSGISDDEKTLKTTKSFSGSSGSKGVHFCPVVAEVNWHDDSDSTTEKDSSYSLSSTPDVDVQIHNQYPPTPPLIRPKPRIPSPINTRMSSSEPELPTPPPQSCVANIKKNSQYISLKPRAISQPEITIFNSNKIVRQDPDGSVINSYIDSDDVLYKHSHQRDVYQSMLPTSSASHVSTSSSSRRIDAPQPQLLEKDKHAKQQSVTRIMEPATLVRRESKTSKTGKLGGFFSRLASFRFSTRKSSDDKTKAKKKTTKVQDEIKMPIQRIATKEDYIYIPLKGPEKLPLQNNNQQVSTMQETPDDASCISAKPPLPKAPPRVIGASVKRRTVEAIAQPVCPEHRTIDSGDVLPRPMEPMGLIETDLDTEVTVITSGAHVKTRSLMNLGAEAPPRSLAAPPHPSRPHKSMEFLLDKQNLKVVEPPENELQKGERVMSENQLRIQRSLQKLTIPDWYKHSQIPREGFLLKKNVTRERWTGTSSKTPSLSSLGSSGHSPIVLSPTPHSQPFVRWSTSKLNSTASSPCASTRSSFNTRQPNGSISPSSARSSFSYRQPYLGWRSQERLARPRTPAERLASSLLIQNQNPQCTQQESPEIQTSIKEVTSAIVHYVSGLKPESASSQEQNTHSRNSSISPRGSQKLCWLESSFVGTRPLDTPQTPVTLEESHTPTPPPTTNLRLELQKSHNGESIHA